MPTESKLRQTTAVRRLVDTIRRFAPSAERWPKSGCNTIEASMQSSATRGNAAVTSS
jgi:hypothetical protein